MALNIFRSTFGRQRTAGAGAGAGAGVTDVSDGAVGVDGDTTEQIGAVDGVTDDEIVVVDLDEEAMVSAEPIPIEQQPVAVAQFEEVVLDNEEQARRVRVVIKTVTREDGSVDLVAEYTKKITGPVRVITFAVDGETVDIILQKGTIFGSGITMVLIEDIGIDSVLGMASLAIVSYGPAGLRPVLESGAEFNGSDSPFITWNFKKLTNRA